MPTLVVGCQRDVVAPVAVRAIPMYESTPRSVSKAYLELAGGDHLCVETGNGNKAIQGKYAVAWMKRFVDDDVRYCAVPVRGPARRRPAGERGVGVPGELPLLMRSFHPATTVSEA